MPLQHLPFAHWKTGQSSVLGFFIVCCFVFFLDCFDGLLMVAALLSLSKMPLLPVVLLLMLLRLFLVFCMQGIAVSKGICSAFVQRVRQEHADVDEVLLHRAIQR